MTFWSAPESDTIRTPSSIRRYLAKDTVMNAIKLIANTAPVWILQAECPVHKQGGHTMSQREVAARVLI